MKTVLVVDDSETDRSLIGMVVRDAGHMAQFASDGDEALERARDLKPDLILLDIVMPRQDGFSVCRKLKKTPETQDIPVVFVTSKRSDVSRYWGEQQGANGYIAKPFSPEELLEVVQKFLR